MLEQIAVGIVTGVGYAIAGWQKKSISEPNKTTRVDWLKFGKSVVVCCAVGAVAGYSGQDFNFLIVGGLGIGVTKLVDLGWSLFKTKFLDK